MESKHTPGPWMINDGADVIVKECPTCFDWTSIACLMYDDNDGPVDETEVAANGRLIAAAPELLEALERICAAEEQHPTTTGLDGLIDNARKIIAKAKGETK